MPQCKIDGCRNQATPGVKRYCDDHRAKYLKRRAMFANRPWCANGCKQQVLAAGDVCGTCRRKAEEAFDRRRRESAIETELEDCESLYELKQWIQTHLLPIVSERL